MGVGAPGVGVGALGVGVGAPGVGVGAPGVEASAPASSPAVLLCHWVPSASPGSLFVEVSPQ